MWLLVLNLAHCSYRQQTNQHFTSTRSLGILYLSILLNWILFSHPFCSFSTSQHLQLMLALQLQLGQVSEVIWAINNNEVPDIVVLFWASLRTKVRLILYFIIVQIGWLFIHFIKRASNLQYLDNIYQQSWHMRMLCPSVCPFVI